MARPGMEVSPSRKVGVGTSHCMVGVNMTWNQRNLSYDFTPQWPNSSVRVNIAPEILNVLSLTPVAPDWVIKGLGMSSHASVTWHIKDPVALMEKSKA